MECDGGGIGALGQRMAVGQQLLGGVTVEDSITFSHTPGVALARVQEAIDSWFLHTGNVAQG